MNPYRHLDFHPTSSLQHGSHERPTIIHSLRPQQNVHTQNTTPIYRLSFKNKTNTKLHQLSNKDTDTETRHSTTHLATRPHRKRTEMAGRVRVRQHFINNIFPSQTAMGPTGHQDIDGRIRTFHLLPDKGCHPQHLHVQR